MKINKNSHVKANFYYLVYNHRNENSFIWKVNTYMYVHNHMHRHIAVRKLGTKLWTRANVLLLFQTFIIPRTQKKYK